MQASTAFAEHVAIDGAIVADKSIDPSVRFAALVSAARLKLEMVLVTTDFPHTVYDAKQLLAQVAGYECDAARPGLFGEASLRTGLGMLGRNGIGPQIDTLVRAAAFHGKPWRAKWAGEGQL